LGLKSCWVQLNKAKDKSIPKQSLKISGKKTFPFILLIGALP
jgi:hypothetical protein